jgi:pseudouridine kinase
MKQPQRTFHLIGGANIDILGKSFETLRPSDSNPGKVSVSFGGVARNIAQNLTNIKSHVRLLTVFGDDMLGRQCAKDCTDRGMDISYSLFLENASSSTYLAIANKDGDMSVAIADMNILHNLTKAAVTPFLLSINGDDVLVVDTNLEYEMIEYITSNTACLLACDPISTTKTKKIIPFLHRLTVFKPNRLEAEVCCGFPITDDESLMKALKYLRKTGIRDVIITLGVRGGAIACDEGVFRYTHKDIPVISATGAGDAFLAAYIAYLHFGSLVALKYGVASAIATCFSEATVDDRINHEYLEKIILKFPLQVEQRFESESYL